jgi:hypothetical protein
MSDVSLDQLVGVYVKMYAKKETLDAELKDLEQKMRRVKVAISDEMRETGMESIKTKAGLVYRTVKTTYGTSDWESMHKFILEHGVPDLLEKRIHQGNMKTYLEEHPEELPPGLNANMEYSVTVKRNKNAG